VLKFHEQTVCEAIVRLVEEREQQTRKDVQSPESVNHIHPVELTWRLGPQLYALEHTGIEPFEGYLRLDAEAQRHFGPIKAAMENAAPTEHIELYVPVGAMQNRSKAEIAQIQAALIQWTRDLVHTMKIGRYADYGRGNHWVSVPGVPFQVQLFRFESLVAGKGRASIVHSVRGDLDRDRTARVGRACEKKFPKLAAWKRNSGARTILVLEENDIQLTNYAIVADTYIPLASSRDDRPDETYLVSTSTKTWDMWPILVGDKTLDDLAVDDYVPRWEIDPANPTPIKVR
jgi:hypothetical protein